MSYLSELFLDSLGSDYSMESVTSAVLVCNAEYESRMNEISRKELGDFWEVYREFDEGDYDNLVPLIASFRYNSQCALNALDISKESYANYLKDEM